LSPEDVSWRKYPLREVFNGVRYIVKSGAHWRLMPYDLLPWPLVYQQLRRAAERPAPLSATILDARAIQSTPQGGARAGYDGHKRRKVSKVHVAVDTLGRQPTSRSARRSQSFPRGRPRAVPVSR
jgi:transposase